MATKEKEMEQETFVEDMELLVPIRLNLLESEGSGKIDQTVNVTRNGKTLVIRGVSVWRFPSGRSLTLCAPVASPKSNDPQRA